MFSRPNLPHSVWTDLPKSYRRCIRRNSMCPDSKTSQIYASLLKSQSRKKLCWTFRKTLDRCLSRKNASEEDNVSSRSLPLPRSNKSQSGRNLRTRIPRREIRLRCDAITSTRYRDRPRSKVVWILSENSHDSITHLESACTLSTESEGVR